MAQKFNSHSDSPIRVGRKVKKIVSSIQSLIDKFPNCCWYDGRWCFGAGRPYVYETACLGIMYKENGVLFMFEDPFGNRYGETLPYGAKLYSRLKALRQLIWVSPGYHNKKDVPSWAYKYGANYR